MADFGYLSDHSDDSAVEDLISQAKDLCVLEQVSAIKCSSFTDSVLPTELENRFCRLKSFPAINSKPKPSFKLSRQHSKSELNNSQAECQHEQNPDGVGGWETKSVLGYDSSPLNSWDSSTENEIISVSKQNPDGKLNSEKQSNSKSLSSPLSSSSSPVDLPSPPRKSGCFWCSPKRISTQKGKEDRTMVGKSDEFLSDLSTFSVKEQQKMLKKAMKEEEKVSREAEKIVKWAKQASMRMSFRNSDNELSDD